MPSPALFLMIYQIIFRSEKKLFKRSFKEDNLNKFNESLALTDWSKLLNMDDPNESYSRFINDKMHQRQANEQV